MPPLAPLDQSEGLISVTARRQIHIELRFPTIQHRKTEGFEQLER